MTAGRPLKLPSNFMEYDFAQLARKEKNARACIRYTGLDNLQKGKGIREVSRILSVHENSVKNWVKRFRKNGIEGLKDQSGRGAKRKLPTEQEQGFREAVLKLQANRKGGRIRGADVLELMKKKFGIDCCLDTAYESLKRANLVWITSRSRHPKTDEEAQESFKKTS